MTSRAVLKLVTASWLDFGMNPHLSRELSARRADLVLEGGGVKGIAFASVISVLDAAGYAFPRIAGTSAGAITGALIAALQRAGEPLSRLGDIAATLDYTRFRDRGAIGRWAGPLAPVVDAFSFIFESGIFEGEYLRSWLSGVLCDLGVATFGDLRLPSDPNSDVPEDHRYGLVVTASDLSRQRLALLPWDYHRYGLDPDEQPVADAVAASTTFPFFFEPVLLR